MLDGENSGADPGFYKGQCQKKRYRVLSYFWLDRNDLSFKHIKFKVLIWDLLKSSWIRS